MKFKVGDKVIANKKANKRLNNLMPMVPVQFIEFKGEVTND